ncbi:hypothetical protein IGB42_00737 [Andreprevotia sp. IGB-42]|nr:hypothetical protein IGB42_00737 [Andreprevotia sp. IGB-42]
MNDVNPYAPSHAELEAAPGTGYELATRSARFGATVVDGLIWVAAMLIPTLLLVPVLLSSRSSPGLGWGAGTVAFFVAMGVAWIALVAINCTLIHRNGQTLGKKALGIRVVCADGQRCSLRRYLFIRSLPLGIVKAIPYLGLLVSLLDSLLIFRETRRCLHDDLANTIVVTT